jgi:hypothetical protein
MAVPHVPDDLQDNVAVIDQDGVALLGRAIEGLRSGEKREGGRKKE